MLASTLVRAGIISAALLLLALTGSALAAQPTQRKASDAAPPWVNGGLQSGATAALTGRNGFSRQHGGEADHLPAARENIELVGKLSVDTPALYRTPEHNKPVEEGQIADLAIYKQAAYLNSWAQPAEEDDTCHRGGFFSADISDPANPRQLAFVPALPETYHGEGAHVVTFNGRDILAVNNEPCGENGVGGFDLYDVTNPAQPTPLVQGAGDQSSDEPEGVGLGSTTQDPAAVPTSAHSIFLWQDGSKLYAVIVDNEELHDVDIFDVTNPAAPQFIADIDLLALADEQNFDLADNSALGNSIFHHDMVVKKIGNVQTMLVSYWDAGYVKLNVNDPTSPTFIGDSDFGTTDPLRPEVGEPEGNGHQAEFSHDNQFVLAADEDFAAFRPGSFQITTGPDAGEYESVGVGGAASAAFLPDRVMNGPTVYGGYGCDASDPIPARDSVDLRALEAGEEAIIVLQRGPSRDPDNPEEACFPGEKAENGINAGYDAVLLINHHAGEAGGAFCGSGDFPADPIVAICTTHEAGHLIFGEESDTTVPYPTGHGPELGATGEDVSADSLFDGWGYMHLFKNTAGDLEPIEDFSIEEAQDERFAQGFGDLSVHEFATDPDVNVAYTAHYAGGMRVFTFGDSGVQQTGKFIDVGGNNFWGVEVFTTPKGERLFAGSDRDSGLYLFRYTGPGAYQPPAPGAPAPPALQASGCGNQIQGTSGRDLIAGTEGSDTVRAAAGDDVIDAKKGDDCLFGDDGEDSVDGQDGNDKVEGGAGADQIKGGNGNDDLAGNAGVDQLKGGSGSDRLGGGGKRDVLSGGGGRDALFGSTGNDAISGGGGNDRISGGTAADRIVGNSGADRITPGKGRDRVIAGKGNDRIFARDGKKDRISCGSGRDRVSADKKDVLTSCERVSRG